MTAVLHTERLTKRYGHRPALTDVDLDIPPGRVVGLVGPNGAGKSTLLGLAGGLITPTSGTITVLGNRPAANAAHLARVGFVAQNTPVYPGLSVRDHLRLGARLNRSWDQRLAERRIAQVGLDPGQKAGRLSGGQHAQLALTIAVAKRPELLILDEPVAALDPLARNQFLRNLMEFIGELEVTVVLSSHLISDLEQVCDHLVLLSASRVQLAGEVDALLAEHHRLRAARGDLDDLPAEVEVITAEHRAGESTVVVRRAGTAPIPGGAHRIESVGLEELILAYLTRAADASVAYQPTTRPMEAQR
ncbi:ABC transporter ATP-binding protein [Rugosimonospora acidiphila]|uniref:ABC transporter ATP-binding protein n=1 Tax=Rugosimonospora acidiphila TaxID=556531 RepID=A0ABP9SDN0_9ACTN